MSNNSHPGYKGVEATFTTIPQMFQKVVSENRDIERILELMNMIK